MGGCASKDNSKLSYELFNFSKEEFDLIKKSFDRLTGFKEKYTTSLQFPHPNQTITGIS